MVKKPSADKHKKTSANKEFLLFLSIPISIILLVSALLIVPPLFAKPKYDFIFSYCPDYACTTSYTVTSSGTISQDTDSSDDHSYYKSQSELYYYDAQTNASKKISLDQAQTYQLDATSVSADGYSLVKGSDSGGGFLFWDSSSDNHWYLKNGLKKKQVNLISSTNYYYSQSIQFVGWVKQ